MEYQEVVYDKLQFGKSKFRFKNKKARGDYWDNLWMENSKKYKEKIIEYMEEDIHVRFSWKVLLGYISWGLLGIACYLALTGVFLPAGLVIAASFLFRFGSILLEANIQDMIFKNEFTLGMLTDEMLESVRQEMIQNESCKTN